MEFKKRILAAALLAAIAVPAATGAYASTYGHNDWDDGGYDGGDDDDDGGYDDGGNDDGGNDDGGMDDGGYDDGASDGGYDDGGDDGGNGVPELDAGTATLGLGLTLGLVAFMRDRRRRK